ncbi:MAG: helix-turn-helix domain-containing protein [Bacillus subtilis]|nr:helix-turn-helix domain-containing protein [Bacillus subtilis]
MIAGLINNGGCNVTFMVKNFNVSAYNFSTLKCVENFGIVRGYRQGNQIYYKIDTDKLKEISIITEILQLK